MTSSKTQERPLRLEWVEAETLADNPLNWRRHPSGQVKAIKTMIGRVGFAGALLYNETTGHLIDGHARKRAVPPGTIVPVLVGRWPEEQEKEILATFDPIGAMALADSDALESLLADVDLAAPSLADLSTLLDGLVEKGSKNSDDDDAEDEAAAEKKKAAARSKRISELFAVIVECKNERDQLAFFRRMKKENRKCKMHVL